MNRLFVENCEKVGTKRSEEIILASKVRHISLWWLKEPGNGQHLAEMLEMQSYLAEIPGVEEVHVGARAATDWSGPDDTFDYCVDILFDSLDAVREFRPHPLHLRAAALGERIRSRAYTVYYDVP